MVIATKRTVGAVDTMTNRTASSDGVRYDVATGVIIARHPAHFDCCMAKWASLESAHASAANQATRNFVNKEHP